MARYPRDPSSFYERFDEARYPIIGSTGFHVYNKGDLVQVTGKGERIFKILYFRRGRNPRRVGRHLTFAYLDPICLKTKAISAQRSTTLRIELRDLKKVSPLVMLAKEAVEDMEEEEASE